tara:strand:+ start:80 stop:382 length:303 start_codon:yes stop_codon:yes gene_type:complete
MPFIKGDPRAHREGRPKGIDNKTEIIQVRLTKAEKELFKRTSEFIYRGKSLSYAVRDIIMQFQLGAEHMFDKSASIEELHKKYKETLKGIQQELNNYEKI